MRVSSDDFLPFIGLVFPFLAHEREQDFTLSRDGLTEKDFPQGGKAWVEWCREKSKRIKNFIKKYKNG